MAAARDERDGDPEADERRVGEERPPSAGRQRGERDEHRQSLCRGAIHAAAPVTRRAGARRGEGVAEAARNREQRLAARSLLRRDQDAGGPATERRARTAGADPDHRACGAQIPGSRGTAARARKRERRACGEEGLRISRDAVATMVPADGQLATAVATEVGDEGRRGPDRAVERVAVIGVARVEHHERARIGRRREVALEQLLTAGERRPVDPRGAAPRAVGPEPLDLGVGGRFAQALLGELAGGRAAATPRGPVVGRERDRLDAGKNHDRRHSPALDPPRDDSQRIDDPDRGRGQEMAAAAQQPALAPQRDGSRASAGRRRTAARSGAGRPPRRATGAFPPSPHGRARSPPPPRRARASRSGRPRPRCSRASPRPRARRR